MTEVQEIPQAFARYARKVSPKQYETAEASISIPIAIPDEGVTDEVLTKIALALTEARDQVHDILGLSTTEAPTNVAPIQSAPSYQPTPQQNHPSAQSAVEQAFPGAATVGAKKLDRNKFAVYESPCPKCGSDMFDNRADRKSPKHPAIKCGNRDCGHADWLD